MTLDEAIKKLEELREDELRGLVNTAPDALKLGIEAIGHVLRQREANPGVAFTVLKGEEV